MSFVVPSFSLEFNLKCSFDPIFQDYHFETRHKGIEKTNKLSFKVHITRNFFISLLEGAFKMMKNDIYFIVIALLVAELFKILGYASEITSLVTSHCGHKMM